MRTKEFCDNFALEAMRSGIACKIVELRAAPQGQASCLRIDHPNGPFLFRDGLFQFVSRLRPQRAGRRLNLLAEATCSSRAALRAVLKGHQLDVCPARIADANHLDDALSEVRDNVSLVRLLPDGANGLTGTMIGARIYHSSAVTPLRSAAMEMIGKGNVLSLEPQHPGQHIYVFCVDGVALSVQLRCPPSLIGNGTRTVYQLIGDRNANQDNTEDLSLRPSLMRALARQGLKLSSIPDRGQKVELGQAHDGATGFDVVPLDLPLNGAVAQLAQKAIAAVGNMTYGAVELFAPDGACLQSGAGVQVRNVIPYADPADFCEAEDGSAAEVCKALLNMLDSDAVRRMTSWPAYAPSKLDDAAPELSGIDAEGRAIAMELAAQDIPYQVSTHAPDPDSEPLNEMTFQLSGHQYSVSSGAIRIRLDNGKRVHINGASVQTTSNKSATKALLADHGISAPMGRTFRRDTIERALTYAQTHILSRDKAVCVKPAAGHGGILVFANCTSLQDVSDALDAVFSRYTVAIVEETIVGEDVRFFYVEPNIVGAIRSVRPSVVGDGHKTILELLNDFNAGILPTGRNRDVSCGADLVRYLLSQSWHLEDVPEAGQQVSLSPLSNAAACRDGDHEKSDIHPSYLEAAKKIFSAIPGVRIGAIDTIISDRRHPATRDNWSVLEMNSSPGVLAFMLPPCEGAEKPYGPAIIDLLRHKGDEIHQAALDYAFEQESQESDASLADQIDASLAEFEAMPAEFLAESQMEALMALIQQAQAHSPFYRDHLQNVLVNGEFFPEAWLALPILKRGDIRLLGANLHCDKIPEGGDITTVSTSGSSGSPLAVRWNRMATIATRSVTQRMYRWHGFDMAGTYAGIRSYAQQEAAFPGMLRKRGWNDFNPDAPFYSLSVDTPIDKQLDWLRMIRPNYLNTYPSVVAELARQALAQKNAPRFDHVLTAGEVVTEEIRNLCTEAFGAQIVDSYGCQEFGKIAVQCEHAQGRLHICTSNVMVEVLDDNDRQVLPGGTGRVVVTSLYNYAMPFIRYEIGDYVTLADGPCPCGRSGPTIAQVHGRRRNMIVLPNGDRRWVAGRTLSELSHILAARNLRLVQKTSQLLEIQYEATSEVSPDIDGRLTQVLQRAVHPSLSARSMAVAKLARSASGKFEDVVGLDTF